MSDLVTYQSKSVTSLMANIEQYKYNPSGIQRAALGYLDEVTSGEVDVVEPTNPFVFLLESSSVNTAVAINENIVNLRKQYASLSQVEADLYLHMSDHDFINRFAVPSMTEFTFVIQVNDLMNKLVYDVFEECYKATIPRNTEFKIDGVLFSLQYPINIRRYLNGVVEISYDASQASPLQALSTNIIDYTIRQDPDQVNWLFFKVAAYQFSIATVYYPVQKSAMFDYDIPFADSFYYCRAYYKNTASNDQWVEMIVTHTDQVYDPFKPTAVISVITGSLNLFIPAIYLTSELVSGSVRIDVYTTKGQLSMNLGNYKLAAFETHLKAIDEARDITDFTNAFLNLSYYSYSDQIVNGGTNGIDFLTLRERVIYNSVGDRQLPITNVQLQAFVNNKGFDLVKNVDVITNRIFLATQKLPKPFNDKLLTAANIGISTFITNLDYLRTISLTRDNTQRFTVLSNNLFLNTNGVVRLISDSERQGLLMGSKTALIDQVNSQQYLYNPFYYVLDSSSEEFELRAYHLDQPVASNLNFVAQNQTLQLPVNTGSYTLEHIPTGFRLTVLTKSGNFYKQLEDGLVSAQLGFYPDGENTLAYINGVLHSKTSDNERVYTFDIETNYDIDSTNRLCILNAHMFTNEVLHTWTALDLKCYLFYTTSSLTDTYVSSDIDRLIGNFMLPIGSAGVTYESLDVELGSALKNLWTRSRSFPTGLSYQKYTIDVPMLYDKDIYQVDPVTGSIFSFDAQNNVVYNVLHHLGDPVLDGQGAVVYQHRAGDPVLDSQGNPIIITALSVDKEIDLLFVDGKYFFANDETFTSYRSELASVINSWIINDLSAIQDVLLEQTKLFFYPKTTIGSVKVYPDGTDEVYIASEQSLVVDLYVRNSVFIDTALREQLRLNTISLLDSYINSSVINLSDVLVQLKAHYGDTVSSVHIGHLGGSSSYNIVTLAAEHNRLCLKKKLVVQQDQSLIIAEDVEVNFHNIEKALTV